MPQSIPAQTLTIVATGIVTKRRFVTMLGALAAAGAHAFGVARYNAAVGDELPVDTLGTTEVEAGGIFAKGDPLTPDATGRAVLNAQPQPLVKTALIAGGAAGDHVVTGILTTDILVSVTEEDGTSGVMTDRTAEFEISAADTINNTGGTSTATDKLLVVYQRPGKPTVARALEAAAAPGDVVEANLIPN